MRIHEFSSGFQICILIVRTSYDHFATVVTQQSGDYYRWVQTFGQCFCNAPPLSIGFTYNLRCNSRNNQYLEMILRRGIKVTVFCWIMLFVLIEHRSWGGTKWKVYGEHSVCHWGSVQRCYLCGVPNYLGPTSTGPSREAVCWLSMQQRYGSVQGNSLQDNYVLRFVL